MARTPASSRSESLPGADLKSPDRVPPYTGATLTVSAAARYSGLSTDKIRDLVRTRAVDMLHRGASGRGRIHVFRASLDAWLEAERVPAIAVAPSRPALDADNDIQFAGESLFS